MTAHQWTPEKVSKFFGHISTALALHGAVKLGLFTILDDGPAEGLTPTELAKIIKADPRAMDMLATALVAVGFLVRQGEKLGLTDFSRQYLSASSPDYYGYIIKHMVNLMPAWQKLDQAVLTGTKVDQPKTGDPEDEESLESFLMGMFNVAQQQADQVTAAFDLSGRHRLLDLGGGPGTYAIKFCQKHSQLTALIFDLPSTENFARKTVARYNLESRIDFKGGDFSHDELPETFDVVWLSQVIHSEGPTGVAKLIKQATKVLEPGGVMGIQEFIIDDDRCGPAQPALFSLNMLVHTTGGQAYTESEIRAMMMEAGLYDIQRLSANLPLGCGIMSGIKA